MRVGNGRQIVHDEGGYVTAAYFGDPMLHLLRIAFVGGLDDGLDNLFQRLRLGLPGAHRGRCARVQRREQVAERVLRKSKVNQV